MDGRRFDLIARALAHEQSRRSALKRAIALIGGGSALAALEPAEAARRGYPGPLEICRSNEITCNGECYPASTTECCADIPCPLGQCAPNGECCIDGSVVCAGSCCFGPCLGETCCSSDIGYPCSPGDGSTYCAPHGSCCIAADCPIPSDPCLQASCSAGSCTTTLAPEGTPCDDFDPCTGAGSCAAGVCQSGEQLGCPSPGACQGAGVCDSSSGSCGYPPVANGTPCGSGQECCDGVCCPPQSSCDGGSCVSTCAALGANCADESECCQDRGITGCEDVCCLANYESCSGAGDCCSGRCNGEFCCAGPNSSCSDDGECCDGELGACDSGVCRCRRQGESCGSSFECCGFDICQGGVCTAGTCTEPGGACRSDFECCDDGGLAYCGQPEFQCCRYTGGDCGIASDCCGSDVCSGGSCCRPPEAGCTIDGDCCSGTCCNGVCCDSLLSCIENICRETCPLGAFPCGATECCGSHEHCIDGGCMCLPLRSECDPTNNLCCQNGDTMCYPIGTVGMEFEHCCQGIGSPCDRANDATSLGSDCCSLSADFTGTWQGACGFEGVCGGRGGVCFSHEECVSGNCRGHCGNQFPVKSCLESPECDCDGDIEDGCVDRVGRCIDTRCQ